MRTFVTMVLMLTACGGSDGATIPDADPNAPLCTGVVYDNCTVSTQCMSANCKLFSQDAIQVCTQPCDDSTVCPLDAAGAVGKCNNMGICKPTRSNACRPQ